MSLNLLKKQVKYCLYDINDEEFKLLGKKHKKEKSKLRLLYSAFKLNNSYI